MATLSSLLAAAASLTKPDRSPDERKALQTALKDLRAAIEELTPGHHTRYSEGQTSRHPVDYRVPQGG